VRKRMLRHLKETWQGRGQIVHDGTLLGECDYSVKVDEVVTLDDGHEIDRREDAKGRVRIIPVGGYLVVIGQPMTLRLEDGREVFIIATFNDEANGTLDIRVN
jgi:hypothetical protein